jgi:DNA-binding NarL/FixJ family response regulator
MTPTVLIIDDDPGFRAALTELLAERGYRLVGQAGSMSEGAALVAALAPEAVVCDVHLPDGDGISPGETAGNRRRCSEGAVDLIRPGRGCEALVG